jgi:filamentous hemagglutinin
VPSASRAGHGLQASPGIEPAPSWSSVQGQLGGDNMWNINRAFLDQQISQGKSFIFTSDPTILAKTNPTSFTAREYNHLIANGYIIEPTGGMYHATKK